MSSHGQLLSTSEERLSALDWLVDVVTGNYHNEAALFEEIVQGGCKLFDMETGIVSKIMNRDYHVVAIRSPLDIRKGQVFDIEGTLCYDVYCSKKAMYIPKISVDERLCSHPVYIAFGIETYFATPVWVFGKLYGTINFTDRGSSRKLGKFGLDILERLGVVVGRFLESHNYKRDLKEANARVHKLIGMVAHDLRSPLSSVYSAADLLLYGKEDEEFSREILVEIQSLCKGSMEMVESLLSSAALSTGKVELDMQEIDLREQAKISWNNVRSFAERKLIRHEILSQLKVPIRVRADRARINQVLCNLFTNAIKFSRKSSTVSTSLSVAGETAQIKVSDRGVGIPVETQKNLFRFDTPSSTKGTEGEAGTGFGLPCAAQLVQAHRGSISVESEVGVGSTFVIKLPTDGIEK